MARDCPLTGARIYSPTPIVYPSCNPIGGEQRVDTITTRSGTKVELGPLARDLPYVIRTVNALLRPKGDAVRKTLGFEAGMIGILSIIWLNPGISQNDVAASVVLKKSSVAKLLKTLEAEGFVTRRRAADDRRMNALTLTEKGAKAVADIRTATEAINGDFFNDVSPEDREAFFRVIGVLLARMVETAAPALGDRV
jgi:DNA-binding MarR family transcriptional regulator